MRSAGIREARQNLTALLEEVKKGREVTITDRGRPVARLVPPVARSAMPFRSLKKLRDSIPLQGGLVSDAVAEDRKDRI